MLPALLTGRGPDGIDDGSVEVDVLADDKDTTVVLRVGGRTVRTADRYSADVIRGVLADVAAGSIGSRILAGVMGWGTTAPRRGTAELIRYYRRSPHLRSNVGRIATSMSATKWRIFASPATGKARSLARSVNGMKLEERKKAIRKALDRSELREVTNHPALAVIDGGNTVHSGLTVRRLGQIYQELKGEQFHALDFNGAGIPVRRWPIPPHWVRKCPDPGEPWFEINYLGVWERVPEGRVLHLSDPDPENPYGRASGIGEVLADELETDEHAAKHLGSWFKNHAMASHLIGVKGADDDNLDEVEGRWAEKHRGPFKNNRVQFHNGELSVVRLDDKFADMEIVDVRRYEATIARETWNMPPEVLGHLDNSNKAAIVEAMKFYATLILVPRCEWERAEYQTKLVPMYPDADRLVVDFDDPTPIDKGFSLEVMKAAPFSATVDEWRELRGAEPEEGGDVRFAQISWLPIRNLSPAEVDDLREPEPAPAPAPGNDKPPPKKAASTLKGESPLRPQDISSILAAFRAEEVQGETDPVTAGLVEDFGQAMIDELGIALGFNAQSQAVADFLQAEGVDRITGYVGETTRQALRDELTAGVAAGEDIPSLAARVRAVFDDADKARSTNIARTEVLRAGNFGRWQGMAQSGLVQNRRWLATGDNRTRDAHAAMNGQQRRIDQPFTAPSGATAMHPGGFNVASLDCQCRCVTLPVIQGVSLRDADQDERDRAIFRAFDRRCARWEESYASALRRGFARQRGEVLQALAAFAPRA